MNNKYLFTGICMANVLVLSAQHERMPNIICILADDIGYSDLGCYGATKIKTPALDRLASSGVRFTNAYSPASTSSPSRYALLTGEYAWRKNVGILPADAPLSINPNGPTLPKAMKQCGYRTALVGKWHLGLGSKDKAVDFNSPIEMGPLETGFEYAFYFPATNDRVPCVYIENDRVAGLERNDPISVSYKRKIGNAPTGKENPEQLKLQYHLGHSGTIVNGISRIGWMSGGKAALWKDETMAETLLGKALAFIRGNKTSPFFLYYAPHNAHEPRVPSSAFRGKSEAGVYGDVIEEFDHCVGRIVEALKREGIYENTIIIVTSDNAPMIKEGYKDGALEHINGHNPYANLRGEKYSLHEGGNKVPFIFSWPAKINKPFVQEQSFIYMDLLATLPALIGKGLKQEERADCKDASALFLSPNAPRYREYIMTQDNGGQISLKKEHWKYLPPRKGNGAELYDLDADPSELHNAIYAYPEIARELQQHVATDYKK